jgi:hypothetical protein
VTRWILLGVTISYVLILAAWQWLNITGDEARHIYRADRGSGGPPAGVALRPRDTVELTQGDGPVALSIVLNALDLQSQTVRATVYASYDESRAFYEGVPRPPQIIVSLTGLSARSSVAVPVPPKYQESTQGKEISIELWGWSNDYPSDGYGSSNFVSIGSGLGHPTIKVTSSGAFQGFNVKVAGDSSYFNLLLTRKSGNAWWVYTMAFAPLIVLVLMSLAHARHRVNSGVLWLEAAVGVVAILPLRQVLVPADVPSLTRVDILLGVELLAFLMAAGLFGLTASTTDANEAPAGSRTP